MELIRFDHVDFSYFSEDDENNEVSADIIKNLNLSEIEKIYNNDTQDSFPIK